MKKTLSILLALVMVLALFTGCVDKGGMDVDSSPELDTKADVEDSGMNARVSGGGASSFEIPVDTQGKKLDDIKGDSGASFRGSAWDTDSLVSAADK